jgi:hypothetical protein
MLKSFYKTNLLTFTNETHASQNSTIQILQLIHIENINIDSSLLDNRVFRNLNRLDIIGSIDRIQVDLFKAFLQIRSIGLKMIHVREFFHRNGIEWIKCINVVAFDMVDLDSAESNRSALRLIRRNAILIEVKALFSYDENRLSFEKRFPDEEFCLYQEFPFRQLIVLTDESFLSVRLQTKPLQ